MKTATLAITYHLFLQNTARKAKQSPIQRPFKTLSKNEIYLIVTYKISIHLSVRPLGVGTNCEIKTPMMVSARVGAKD